MATTSTAQRRWWKQKRTVVLSALLVLLAGAFGGALYEGHAVRRDAGGFPAPGQMVDVGGRQLHLVCSGEGNPPVLFEPAGFSNSTSYGVARSALARHTRVCIYDRVGIGWSDPGPSEISAGMLVEDLRRLLDAANLRSPLILVPSSIGGLTAELFARRYPQRVAGLVFLDAANSEAIARRSTQTASTPAAAVCVAARAAGAVGLVRLLDPWNMRHARTEEAARSAALMYGAKPWTMLCGMVRAVRTTLSEFATAPALPREIPITALSAETRDGLLPPAVAGLPGTDANAILATLRQTHQHLAQRSAHGTWRIVPGSDHLIASSQLQAVIDAVVDLIGFVREQESEISASSHTGTR